MPGSLQGYRTTLLAWLGDEEAKQSLEMEKPWFDMFGNSSSVSPSFDSGKQKREALNKEVEIWLGSRIDDVMTDAEKQRYLNHLTDEQYQQMLNYKNEWYGFMASKTLLENSYKLADPSATWLMKYKDFAGKEAHYANSLLTPDEAVTTPTQQLADRWNERYSKNVQYWTNERGETYVIRDDNNFWNRLANISFGSLVNLLNTGTQWMMNIMDKWQSAIRSALDRAILWYETDPDFYRQSDTTLINDVAQAVGSAASLAVLGAGTVASPRWMAWVTALGATKPGEAVLDLTYWNLNKLVNWTLDKVDFKDYLNTQSLDSLSNAVTLGISIGLAKHWWSKIRSSKIGQYANTINGMVKNWIKKSIDYAKVQADYENFSKVKWWKPRWDDILVETESYQPWYRWRVIKAGWEWFIEGINEKMNPSKWNLTPYEWWPEVTVDVTTETTPSGWISDSIGNAMLSKWNKMWDLDASNFNKNYGTTYWSWLANRWFNKSYENNIQDIIQYEKQLWQQKANALNEIQQKYSNPSVDDMLNESIKKAKNLRSDDLTKLDSLSLKNQEGWLTPSDIYWLSEWYGENFPISTSQKNANIFNRVDRFLEEISNENWLSQYRDLTKEINATRDIIRDTTKYYNKLDGSWMNFWDWVDVATFLMNPKSRPGILLKQTLKNPKIKDAVLERLVKWKSPEERNQIKIDLDKIRKIQDEMKQQEAFDEWQKKWDISIEEATQRMSNRLPEQTQGWVVAWDKWFVTPNWPTYEEMGLGQIREINQPQPNQLLRAILQQLKEMNKIQDLPEEKLNQIFQQLSPESQQKLMEISDKMMNNKRLTNRDKKILESVWEILSREDLNIEDGIRKMSDEEIERLSEKWYRPDTYIEARESLEEVMNAKRPGTNKTTREYLKEKGVEMTIWSPSTVYQITWWALAGYHWMLDRIIFSEFANPYKWIIFHEFWHRLLNQLGTTQIMDMITHIAKRDWITEEAAFERRAEYFRNYMQYNNIDGKKYLVQSLWQDMAWKINDVAEKTKKEIWDLFDIEEDKEIYQIMTDVKYDTPKWQEITSRRPEPLTERMVWKWQPVRYQWMQDVLDPNIESVYTQEYFDKDLMVKFKDGTSKPWKEYRKTLTPEQLKEIDTYETDYIREFVDQVAWRDKGIKWEGKFDYDKLRNEKDLDDLVRETRNVTKKDLWLDAFEWVDFMNQLRDVNPDIIGITEKNWEIYLRVLEESYWERYEQSDRPGQRELRTIKADDYLTEEDMNKFSPEIQEKLKFDTWLYQGWEGWLNYSEWKNLKLGNWYYFWSKKQAKEFGPSILRLERWDRKFYEPKDTQSYQVEASKNGWKEAFNKKLQEEWYDGIKAYNEAFQDYEYNFFSNPFK